MAVNVVLKSVWDDRGVRDAQAELGNLGRSVGVAFAAVGAAVVGAGVAVGKFSLDAINAASAFNAEFEGVNQIFGETAASVQKFAKEASRSAGISETAALQAAKNFGVFATSAGLAGSAASDFAIDLTQAAGDLASFNDVPVEETLAAIRSGLQGQGEPLSRFGILMSEATLKAKAMEMGIIQNTKAALTPQQKVLAANKLILDELGVAQGDFAKYQNTFGNQIKTVTAEFANLQAEIGTKLIPVAEEFLGSVLDLTPALGKALVPAAEEFATLLKDLLVPKVKEFTSWLASPQGTQTLKDLAKGFVDTIRQVIEFSKYLVENWDKIVAVTTVLVSLYGAIKIFTTVTTAARAAVLLFGTTLSATPLGALLVVLGLTTAAVIAFTKEVTPATQAIKNATNASTALEQQQIQLKEKIKQGGLGLSNYKGQLIKVNDRLMEVKTGFSTSAGEANKFGNIKLTGLNNEIDATALKLKGLFNQFGETTGEAQRFANLNPDKNKTTTTTTTTTTTGPTAAEQAAEARKQVQKIIKDAQKRVADAQATYRKAVAAADKAFIENEIKIRQDYGVKLAGIIEQSKNRIRDAFRSVAEYNVSTFLQSFRDVESARLKSFEDAKKSAEELGTAFTDVFVAGDPVKAYLDNLRAKIASNKKILDTSAKLLQAGFSQTFIEQIIATGETGGLALAEGLLASSPETIAEVQSLFKQIENVSTTGADTLANNLYTQQGLATQELITLFDDTNKELNDALAQNYIDYTKALNDAGTALKDAIKDITDDFNDAITEMDGKLGGLGATIKAFRAMLTGVADETVAATTPLPGPGGTNPNQAKMTPELWDAFDMGSVNPSNLFTTMPVLPNTASSTGAGSNTTVINVNVRTDQTQSTAQVGSVIANAINKYTANGGKLAV